MLLLLLRLQDAAFDRLLSSSLELLQFAFLFFLSQPQSLLDGVFSGEFFFTASSIKFG